MEEDLPVVTVENRSWHDFDVLKRLGHIRNFKDARFVFPDLHGLRQGEEFILTSTKGVVKSERSSRHDRVLLSCEWFRRWAQTDKQPPRKRAREEVPQAKEEEEDALVQSHECSDTDSMATDESISFTSAKLLRGVKMPERVELSMLPKIELSEDEWFHGHNLDFRGERHYAYLYVRMADVSEHLGVRPDLSGRRTLDAGDYITVYHENRPTNYLRYRGLLRLLFSVRKNKLVDEFQTWAASALFLMQFPGDTACSSTAVPHSLCRPFLRMTVGNFSGFVAIWLNTVNDLRSVLAIPNVHCDDNGVFHLDFTTNLALELAGLRERYKIRTCSVVTELQVVLFAPIDVKLLAVARRRLEHEMRELLPRRLHIVGSPALYSLSESDLTLLRKAASIVQSEVGEGLVDHAVSESKRALKSEHREEMKAQRLEYEQQSLDIRRQQERQQTAHDRQQIAYERQILELQRQLQQQHQHL